MKLVWWLGCGGGNRGCECWGVISMHLVYNDVVAVG